MTRGRRALLLVATSVALALLGGAPAGAHNQRTAFLGDYGPYDVVASVRDQGPAGQDATGRDSTSEDGVLLEVVIRTKGDRDPVDDARLTVTADGGGRQVGPLPVERYGNVYRVVLPGDDVDTWDVAVELSGPPGATTISEQVPGPRTLHGGTLLTGGSAPSIAWTVLMVLTLVILPLTALTPWWRTAMVGAGVVLLAVCATASWQVWGGATTQPAERVGLVPVAVLAILLAVGLVLATLGRDDARGLVFAGSAGLAVLVGWVNRDALTAASAVSVLSPTAARATASLALGCGGGLALMMVVASRDRVQAAVATLRRRQPPAPGIDGEG